MSTVTLTTVTNVATLEADLDQVTNGSTGTDYVIPISTAVTAGPSDVNSTSQVGQLAVTIPASSTLEFDGPGSLTITQPNQLDVAGISATSSTGTTAGVTTVNEATTGTVALYNGILDVDGASGTSSGGGRLRVRSSRRCRV